MQVTLEKPPSASLGLALAPKLSYLAPPHPPHPPPPLRTGMGYMRDMEINALYRTVKVGDIAGGSMEMRKLIVAKELLAAAR